MIRRLLDRVGNSPSRCRVAVELAAACTVYLALAVWLMAPVVRVPGASLIGVQGRPQRYQALEDSDQSMVLANVTSAARALVSRPGDLWDNGQCHPFPRSRTLGEPMIVDGLLAAVPLAVSGEPILALNADYLLRILAAAVGMCLLVRLCTGSAGAGFVAGLLFGFEPHRLRDLVHPYIASSVLAPLAILLAVRLVETRRWRVAIALGVVLGLQLAESFYSAVALGIVGGCCGLALLVHARRDLGRLTPRLLLTAGLTAAAGVAVYRPFLETLATWHLLQGRFPFLNGYRDFGLGGPAFPGAILLALAAIAIADRLWGGRRGVRDLRVPLAVGGALVFWLVVWRVPLPWIGPLPSPYLLGLKRLPGFGAVRVIAAIRVGVYLAGTALAGFGVAALLRPLGRVARVAVVVAIGLLAMGELFFGGAPGLPFGTRYEAHLARPSAALLGALARLPQGPVVDVPPAGKIALGLKGHQLFLSAFHGRPIATCSNSLVPETRDDVERLVGALPEPTAIIGLVALGFRGVVLHTEVLASTRARTFRAEAAKRTEARAVMTEVAEGDGHVAYAITSNRRLTHALRVLARSTWSSSRKRPVVVTGPVAPVPVPFYNSARDFFVVSRPLRPSAVAFTWRDQTGRVVSTERGRLMPPLVIAPQRWAQREVNVAVPARSGFYTLTVEVTEGAPWEISRVTVEVRSPTPRRMGPVSPRG